MAPTLLASAQHYREDAERIRRDAKRAVDQDVRRQLLDIAEQYEKLADCAVSADNRLLPISDRATKEPQ